MIKVIIHKNMKKNIIIIVITIILIILIIGSLFVYASTNTKENTSLEEKVSKEIEYLDSYLIAMLGNFNGLTIANEVFQLNPQEKELEKEEVTKSNFSDQTNNANGQNEQSQANNESAQNGKNEQTQADNSQNNKSGDNGKMQNSILANNGNYETNWDDIKQQVEQLYSTWNTISLDLHALNIDGNSILSFSNGLNSATKKIKSEDKKGAMEELGKLHQLLPTYMNNYKSDEKQKQILNIQSKVVISYINITNEEWDKAKENLTQAEQNFANMINTQSMGNSQNQNIINQSYILVNELINAVNLKDKDIFYIQYQNLITKMEVLF